MEYASRIQLQDGPKLAINRKNDNWVTIFDMTSSSSFFTLFYFLVKFTCWSKFHVNIITGSRVMIIFFYKRLTRNLEIGNTPVWVLPNIWRLGQVRDTKFDTDVSNEMLLNTAECQIYSFHRLWVIKVKQGVKVPPLPQISVKR